MSQFWSADKNGIWAIGFITIDHITVVLDFDLELSIFYHDKLKIIKTSNTNFGNIQQKDKKKHDVQRFYETFV